MAKKKTADAKSGSSLPTPENREEMFLAKAAGESVTLPTYNNDRKEIFLRAIANKTDLPSVPSPPKNKILTLTNSGEIIWSNNGIALDANITDGNVLMYNDSLACYEPEKIAVRVDFTTALNTGLMTALQAFLQSAAANNGAFTVYETTIQDSDSNDFYSAVGNVISKGVFPNMVFFNTTVIPVVYSNRDVGFSFYGMTNGIVFNVGVYVGILTEGHSVIVSGFAKASSNS